MHKILRVWLLGVAVPLALSACAAAGPTPPPLNTHLPATALPTSTEPAAAPTATLPSPTATPPVEPTTAPTLPAPTEPAPTAAPPTAAPTATPDMPPRLVIPKLEVDQSIVPVLITDGTWDLDHLDKHVGWLTTTGAEPGDDLAMTLAGHVNISLGNPGPFLNLKQLKAGDQVIYRAAGLDYVYSVLAQATVKPDAVDELYVPDGNQLLLVTCSDWSYFWSHYARRLIVTTTLVTTVPSP